ncbi:MAG: hypothetical protein GWP08_19460, partial [Nitrospiraceae bacterium]|nr:hypothetical protein [Nitrospiraceae bacterium]
MANKLTVKWKAHTVLMLASLLFLVPFLWMFSTSLKHESRIFPKPGEPPQWIPTTEKLDEEGRRLVTYNGE